MTVAALVVTSSTIIPTPLEAGLIQGADLTNMSVTEFVYGSVARATVPALLITAFVHMWWQKHCDKVDARKAHADDATAGSDTLSESDRATREARASKGTARFLRRPSSYATVADYCFGNLEPHRRHPI